MTRDELAKRYRTYFEHLNAGRLRDAMDFYADTVTLNGERMTREQYYETAIALPYSIAPDTTRTLGALVIESNVIAVRLLKTGTAVREYMGMKPVGHPVSFREHNFYHMTDGRCTEVWSLIDVLALMHASQQGR